MNIAKDLRVLVTAGASGIGRAFLEAFHGQGARVYICDIDQVQLDACAQAFAGIGTSLTDVADPAQVERLFDAVEKRFGGLDVLINNAGIAGPTAPVEEIDPADWARTMAVNINGQFLCARRAVPLLKKTGDGAIINLASVAGRLGYPLRTPYAASKWAVVGFTESLAMEVGPAGIRVNAILPGVVKGDRIRRVIDAKAQATGVSYDEMEQQYLNKVSLRRMVSAGDIANMALFLCSPAGRNITGQALSVCGNVEVLQ